MGKSLIECVVNISEGRRIEVLDRLRTASGPALLDVHADPFHHRSVFTLIGTDAIRSVARTAVEMLDLRAHAGVHPRLGVVDVVPFVPLAGSSFAQAVESRNEFAAWAADELGMPCFLYGPERTLPDVRRTAWKELAPDLGPSAPHPTAGAMCVGARYELVAYNVYLRASTLTEARRIAAQIREPRLRALGLQLGDEVQVSMNLVDPAIVGPAQAYDAVARYCAIDHSELVGLLTDHVLQRIPRWRWEELDVGEERTIEWRLARAQGAR